MADCTTCHQPHTSTAYGCHTCAGTLRAMLWRLADLAPELDVTIARQARTGTGGSGADREPLPVDLGATMDAWAVTHTVTTWARHVATTRGHSYAPAAGERDHQALAATARWLVDGVTWLRRRPEWAQAYDEILDAARLAERTVDRRIAHWYAGPCGAEITNAPAVATAGGITGEGEGDRVSLCDTELYAAPGAYQIRCPGCGAVHDLDARRDWLLESAEDVIAHAELIGRALAALGLDVTGAQIRTWAARGHITPMWTRPPGPVCARRVDRQTCGHDSCAERRLAPRYRVGDVIAYARQKDEARRDRQPAGRAA